MPATADYPSGPPPDATHADQRHVVAQLSWLLRPHGAEHLVPAVLALVTRPETPRRAPVSLPLPAALSDRETQVLRGMSRGRRNGEIGAELFISEDTVKTHARRVFKKMGARDRAHAVSIGYQCGVLPGEQS